MAISAHNTQDHARQLLVLTERLSERLAAEIAAFEAHRPFDIHATVEETRALSALYRQETARVKADPSLLSGLDVATKTALRAATESFMAVSERHARAVEAAKTISEGIMKAVADEMAETRKPSLTYGPGAGLRDKAAHSLNYGFKA
ncbi:flagellar basal-body protein FlbY [Asticcacaulis sp. BYS171W]|uniref:Flagellar basal-body protein FlbY n=1 Tax=Asticcacaulis aquaticus TaxID=2984212 RepID=A0ABT5HW64_9CAUL|nr:flagellar basal-body protein FlbY [Asticcacaulis aquaticus]MDC7684298.1 flagellar basal-body protein FlbY [Asticcacaulis aquaticus]